MFQVRLKMLRENTGLSQYSFASIMGVAQSTVGMWESGKREPDYKMTQRLADYFNVTTDYLLGRTSDPKPPDTKLQDDELSNDGRRIGQLYDQADDRAREIVDVTLKPFDTVRVFKAARSEDHTPPGYTDIPRSTLDKIKTATPVMSDDEI